MDLMKFLPYKQITILTAKSPDEAVNILHSHLDSNSPFFTGNVDGYRFVIHRKMGRFERNSFVPIIKGNIENHPQGAEIKLIIRLHLAVAVFLACFSAGVLYSVINDIMHRNFFPLVVVGMILFTGLFLSQVYGSEADQATRALKKLFS